MVALYPWMAPSTSGGTGAGTLFPFRHPALPRDLIFRAACESHRDLGYARMTVGDITKRAGVSTATFYRFFEDKPQCVVAARTEIAGMLLRELALRTEARSWRQRIEGAVEVTLDFATRAPAESYLLHTRLALGDRRADVEPSALQAFLVDLLRSGREEGGAAGLPVITERTLIGGIRSLIAARIATREEHRLPALRNELVEVILVPYLGPTAAGAAGRSSAD